MLEKRNFDTSSNLDWQEEIEWGQRYIQQFDVSKTPVEDLGSLLWQGIIKRRTWLLEADIAIERWNSRHSKKYNILTSLNGQKPVSISKFDTQSIVTATVFLPAMLSSLGTVTGNETLVKAALPVAIVGSVVSTQK